MLETHGQGTASDCMLTKFHKNRNWEFVSEFLFCFYKLYRQGKKKNHTELLFCFCSVMIFHAIFCTNYTHNICIKPTVNRFCFTVTLALNPPGLHVIQQNHIDSSLKALLAPIFFILEVWSCPHCVRGLVNNSVSCTSSNLGNLQLIGSQWS